MPNWTTCKLEAPRAVIEKYLTKDENGKLIFDFNRVIPRPDVYSDPEMSEGGDTDMCIYWYLSNRGKIDVRSCVRQFPDIFNPVTTSLLMDNSIDYAKKMEKFCVDNPVDYFVRGKKYVNAYKTYGYTTWYTWCNNNWGTKWNACDSDVYFDENDFGYVTFDTAWSYPEPIVNKIFEDNPNCVINFSWYDEDYNGHHGIGRNEYGEWFRWTDWDPEMCADEYEEYEEEDEE